ncbi:MAG: tRNA (5-methylaminomethyl-2-thiouridine)(34)-methyltransferase MnmD [Bacteroidales bacterium]|nr:tRNA (5-methylaminomethyl-2-thiouridine)(34)-methyltransferase MnmD [Bacteroidales bacterium]
MKTELIITADKSPTLYVPELNEHYHSVNGALQESMHIFINAGLKQIKKKTINILEIGFGTGLNAVLTLTENIKLKKEIYYETIEKYPLKKEILNNLQETDIFSSTVANQILKAVWEKEINISDNFKLKKLQIDLLEYKPKNKYDLIYFDAFSPQKQPKLWTKKIFSKLYKATKQNGILTTYSSKGTVKQALRNAGYTVKRLPGPAGKRHMVQAIKT